ncbi:MAG: hemolysin family protein [Oscillospiraceae bacterium]
MDDTSSLPLIMLLFVLILLSAFFSASETAFSSLNKIRLKHYVSGGNKKALKALNLSEDYDTILSTILVGNNVVNIASASIGTVLFTNIFGQNGIIVSTFFMTIVVLIFGEILPKSLAKQNAEKTAIAFSTVLQWLTLVLKPIIKCLLKLKRAISKDDNSKKNSPSVTEVELKYIIDEIETQGVLDEEEGKLLRSALDFDDIYSEEVLTPRVDIVGINVNDSNEKLKYLFFETKFSRIPVYKDNIDNIIGVITQQKFFTYLLQNKTFKIKDIMQNTLHVPPKKLISDLMVELQSKKLHMAVVTDEYGGTLGILTLEDILEELVGDIWDEHEDIVNVVETISENKFSVSGDTNLYDFFDEVGYDYTNFSTTINTVNGWVMDVLDKLPDGGEKFVFDNLVCTVIGVDEKRICHLTIEKINV